MKIAAGVALCAGAAAAWILVDRYIDAHRRPLPMPETAQAQDDACVLWFIGSSTIARWDTLDADMRPWIARNRGVGGATFEEINRRFALDEDPRRPEAIILYAGDNDIAFGDDVEHVLAQLQEFLVLKTIRFRDVPVFIVSLKPSPERWGKFGDQELFNGSARRIAEKVGGIDYIDTASLLLVDGRPGPYFDDDGIHLNADGYRIWSAAVNRALSRGLPAASRAHCAPSPGRAATIAAART